MPISRLSQPPASAVQDAHDHGAATGSAGPYVHETFIKPEAPATSKGTIASDSASESPTGQPSHAFSLDVVFDAGWDGGDVTITGTGASGGPLVETFTGGDGVTRTGAKAFATITSIANSLDSGAGVKVATVQTGSLFGVANTGVGFVKLIVDGVPESTASTNSTNGTFAPTTSPNGAKAFEIIYSTGHTHSIAAATPTITVS